MAILIDKLKDKLGNFIYPITSTNAVYSADGLTRLDNKLTSIDTATDITFTPISGYTFTGQMYVKNNQVNLVGYVSINTGNIPIPFNSSIGTFSTTYAPSASVNPCGIVYGSGYVFGNSLVSILSTGAVYIAFNTANVQRIYINTSWKI